MVYFKYWVNEAYNNILGGRWTLDVQSGGLLQAGLAALVTIAGGAFWSITAYILFRCAVRKDKTDALGASLRFLLVNPGTAPEDAWVLLRLGLRWKGHAKRAVLRCFSLLLLALLLCLAFTVASLFVSRVTLPGYYDDLAPIDPSACGLLNFSTTNAEGQMARANLIQENTRVAQTWVQQCYTPTPDPILCTGLPMTSLPYTSSSTPCPWEGDRCIPSSNSAWRMETPMIDSYEHLGVNAPQSDRVGVRIVNTCSVINYLDVLEEVVDDTTNGSFSLLRLYFGSIPEVSNYTWQYATHTLNDGVSYQLCWPVYLPAQGSLTEVIPAMNSSDGDLVLALFTANSVVYTKANNDPLYLASGNNTIEGYIAPDYYVRVIACHQQYQFHNPTNQLNSTLDSIFQLQIDSLGFNDQQTATTYRISNALLYSDTYNNIAGLGGQSLLANSKIHGLFSPGLPDDQWIAEVQYWFETGLAKISRYMVDFPTNSQAINRDYITIQDPSSIAGLQHQCKTQLGSTLGSHQTFSVLGIAIVLAVCLFAIFLSWILARCVQIRDDPGSCPESGYQRMVVLAAALEASGYKGFLRMDTGIPVRPGSERNIWNPTLIDDKLCFARPNNTLDENDAETSREDNSSEGGDIGLGSLPPFRHM